MKEEYVGWLDDEWNTILDQSQPIVRCHNCKFYKRGDDGWWCLRSISMKSNHPNCFCAWGETRERESVEVWNQWGADDVTCSEES